MAEDVDEDLCLACNSTELRCGENVLMEAIGSGRRRRKTWLGAYSVLRAHLSPLCQNCPGQIPSDLAARKVLDLPGKDLIDKTITATEYCVLN
jgi:hypothetical protein